MNCLTRSRPKLSLPVEGSYNKSNNISIIESTHPDMQSVNYIIPPHVKHITLPWTQIKCMNFSLWYQTGTTYVTISWMIRAHTMDNKKKVNWLMWQSKCFISCEILKPVLNSHINGSIILIQYVYTEPTVRYAQRTIWLEAH